MSWRTKSKDGKAVRGKDGKPIRFVVEPHGDRSNLPRALQKVSLSEVPEYIEKQRHKKQTPEEAVEEAMIEEIIEEEQNEKNALDRLKDGFNKLDKAIKKEQMRQDYKGALETVKAEHMEDDVESLEEGYGEAWQENLDKKRKEKRKFDITQNEVFG